MLTQSGHNHGPDPEAAGSGALVSNSSLIEVSSHPLKFARLGSHRGAHTPRTIPPSHRLQNIVTPPNGNLCPLPVPLTRPKSWQQPVSSLPCGCAGHRTGTASCERRPVRRLLSQAPFSRSATPRVWAAFLLVAEK